MAKPSIIATARQLLNDCLRWETVATDAPIPERFAEMSHAMLRVARFVRTGTLGHDDRS